MLLRSYSYGTFMGVSELPPDVLNLFKSLVDENGKKISYASEIVFAALAGNIKLDDSFNIDAYISTIRKNERLCIDKKRIYESSYTLNSGCDEDGVLDLGYCSQHSTDSISDSDDYTKIEDDEFLQYSVSMLKEINKDFISDYGIDLIFCIKRALGGIPSALATLKDVCNNFDNIKDMIHALLTSEKDLDSIL